MRFQNLTKLQYIIFVVISLGSLVISIEQFEQNEYILEDYLSKLHGRQFAVDFFKYAQNYTGLLLSKESNQNSLIDSIDDNSAECVKQIGYLFQHIINRDIWALQVPDSWGRVPSGILYGNLFDLGNFDECIRVHKEISNESVIIGKYCSANIPIGKLSTLPDYVFFRFATCIPASCSAYFMDKVFKEYSKFVLNITMDSSITILKESQCKVKQRPPLSGAAKATICILSIMTTVAIFCTLLDYVYTKSARKLHPLISTWSIRANSRQVFRIVDYSKNPNVIPSLNGIRCLSLIWVMYCHGASAQILMLNQNLSEIVDILQTPSSMLLSQGFFSVDSFFFIGALLLVMISLREMDKTGGKLNLPLMYLHRYLRLTPIVGFAILFYSSMKFMSNGPYWKLLGWRQYEVCDDNWWVTLLYVQNYVRTNNMCLSFSWYLAVDMHLYILSPIVIFAMWKWGKKGVAGTIILGLLMWACLFSMMMMNDYTMFYKRPFVSADSMMAMYFPTHTRVSPWIVGLIFGYYLHQIKGKHIKLSVFQVLLGWIISFSLISASIFSLLPKGQSSAPPLTTLEASLFISLSRIAWPLALCWIVFAGIQGYAGPIDSFLGSPLWQPLARLSYCMYIFHFFIINFNTGRLRVNSYLAEYDLILLFWSTFICTILLSLYMHLIIEAPLAGIELFILRGRAKTIKRKQDNKPVDLQSKDPVNEIKLTTDLKKT